MLRLFFMGKKDKIEIKDTIMYTYHMVMEQIEFNNEYRDTPEAKNDIKKIKNQIKNFNAAIKKAGLERKEITNKKEKSNIEDLENELRNLEGKPYYFRVDDGFRTYKIKKSTIESKGYEEATIYILKKFRDSINMTFKDVVSDDKISDKQKEDKLDVLARLYDNITKNINKMKEGGGDYDFEDYYSNKIFGKPYPIFVNVTLNNIKIGL